MRAENPKLLILNAVKGAADFDDGRRRFYEGSMFQDSSKLTEFSIMEQKKIGDASYAYPDPAFLQRYLRSHPCHYMPWH